MSRRKGTRQGHSERGRQRAAWRRPGGQRHPRIRGRRALSPKGAIGEGGWRLWTGGAGRAPHGPPEGSVGSTPACCVCLTLQTVPTAASVGLGIQAGGWAWGNQPLWHSSALTCTRPSPHSGGRGARWVGTGRPGDPPQWPHPRGSILGRPCPSQLALPASPVQGPQASHTAHAPATVGEGRTGVDRGAQRDAGCAGESGAAEQGAPVQQPVGQCLGTPQLPLLSRETSPRWGPGQRSSDAFLGKGSGPRKRAGQRDSWTGRPLVAADRSQVRRPPGGKPVFGRHRRGRNPSRRSTEQRATGPPHGAGTSGTAVR